MVSEDLEEPCGAEPQPAISMESRGNSGVQHQLSVHSAVECPLEQGGPGPAGLAESTEPWLAVSRCQGPGEGSSEQTEAGEGWRRDGSPSLKGVFEKEGILGRWEGLRRGQRSPT